MRHKVRYTSHLVLPDIITMISAHNDQGSMKRRDVFSRKNPQIGGGGVRPLLRNFAVSRGGVGLD